MTIVKGNVSGVVKRFGGAPRWRRALPRLVRGKDEGPATIVQDVLSLLVYFTLGSWLLG